MLSIEARQQTEVLPIVKTILGVAKRRRRGSVGKPRLFFEPFQLHLQPPNLLVELRLQPLFALPVRPPPTRQNPRETLQSLPLPVRDLHRMHPEPGGQFVHRSHPTDRLTHHVRLELPPMLTEAVVELG